MQGSLSSGCWLPVKSAKLLLNPHAIFFLFVGKVYKPIKQAHDKWIYQVCVCVCALLTEAAELAYDVGQGYVSHTLQLILDVPWQHRVAQVPGLDGALYQRHPSAATPLPAGVRWRETGRGEGGNRTKLHQWKYSCDVGCWLQHWSQQRQKRKRRTGRTKHLFQWLLCLYNTRITESSISTEAASEMTEHGAGSIVKKGTWSGNTMSVQSNRILEKF